MKDDAENELSLTPEQEYLINGLNLMSAVEVTNKWTKQILDRLPSDDIVVRELRAAVLKTGDDAIGFFGRWQEMVLKDISAVHRDTIMNMAITWRNTVQAWNSYVVVIANYYNITLPQYPKGPEGDLIDTKFPKGPEGDLVETKFPKGPEGDLVETKFPEDPEGDWVWAEFTETR